MNENEVATEIRRAIDDLLAMAITVKEATGRETTHVEMPISVLEEWERKLQERDPSVAEEKSVEGLLARIRELDALATKGPWWREQEHCDDVWSEHGSILHGFKHRGLEKCMGQFSFGDDAEWVAESRSLLPHAAAVIEELLRQAKERG